jgi:hypothetical protein
MSPRTSSAADGIHLTGGSHDGTVVSPVVNRPGDDGVAVVSYGSDPATSARITVTSPVVNDQLWGRGVSVVGGEDITYRDVVVNGSAGAAVYVASEGEPYYTRSVARVLVSGARVSRANTVAGIGHGAVLVYSGRSETSVRGVRVENMTVTGPPRAGTTAVNLRCTGGQLDDVVLLGIRVDRAYAEPFSSTCSTAPTLDVAFS